MNGSPLPIILILGPTAGGKTELAIELARRLPAGGFGGIAARSSSRVTPGSGNRSTGAGTSGGGGECICADSMQVYRGMDIGTAKPPPEQRQAAAHHLIDVADPADDNFNVDRWLELAERAIADIRGRGRFPIVVGGTNLYVQMLLTGICDAPPPEDLLRARLQDTPLAELRTQLERIDPAAALRIHRNDRRRTIRALEVHQLTGRRISEMQTQWSNSMRNDVIIIGLEFPIEEINTRINARVKRMISDGLVEEVKSLYESGRLGRQAREALGYNQIIDHLEGRLTLAEAIEQIKIRTRRFAKQQRTWLRRFRGLPELRARSLWFKPAEMAQAEIVERSVACVAACVAAPQEAVSIGHVPRAVEAPGRTQAPA